MQYLVWLVASMLVRRLPTRARYAIASIAGTITYYAWPRGRRATERNFRRVLRGKPRSVVRRTARQSIVNYCKYLADFIRFPALPPDEMLRLAGGREPFAPIDAILQRGRGAIIVCMHFGNWDLGAGAAAAAGAPLTAVAESFADARLDRAVIRTRERAGIRVVKMEKAATSLYRALQRNELLALLIDRPTPGDGVRVPFFGEDVEVPAGPARLALMTGAPVVPAAFARTSSNAMDVRVLADLDVSIEPTGNRDADVYELTRRIMAAHERFISQYPDQWYMFRDMWGDP
ncbi:MAG: lysophospholipid acyltransferase family protein [Dehalococcoidia bacterium]